jgi:hypothetical protein
VSAFVSVRAALRAHGPAPETSAAALAARAVATLSSSVVGVIFFGSRRTQASPDPWSAYDFFVVVKGYGSFYSDLHQAGRTRRDPRFLAALNRVLAPSQISLRLVDPGQGELHAKCSVMSLKDLRRETGPRRRDHFTIGRLFQPSEVLYAADETAAEALRDCLLRALTETYRWGRPWLPPVFDAFAYGQTLLRVSMSREIRPEPSAKRAEALFEAQRAEQVPVYTLLLADLAREGELQEIPPMVPGAPPAPLLTYTLARPVTFGERLRLRLYFQRSLLRTTARWLKHVFTFDDWLDYILRKVRRHVGEEIVLSPRERSWPLVFLWPRIIRYLRHKDDRAGRPS